MVKKINFLFFCLFLSACNNPLKSSTEDIVKGTEGAIGCRDFRSKAFDTLYSFIEKEKITPDMDLLRSELKSKLIKISDQKEVTELTAEVINLFSLLLLEKNKPDGMASTKDLLRLLIQFEFENTSDQFHRDMNNKISDSFHKISLLSKTMDIECGSPPSESAGPSPVSSALPRAVWGARWAFATAYQSCQALELPDMDSHTESVTGVLKTNVHHADGIGYKRIYASIPDIQSTHYYIRGFSYGPSCFSVKDKPLVYDYGGEPKIESNGLNFFVNAGTGTDVLGVDCSAFVSTALGVGGMRYSPGVANKPIFIRQGSSDFIDPITSGWKCFDRIIVRPTSSIKPGDIMAVHGHVVMIDKVGEDPFGIDKIQSQVDCAKATYNNFNFTIMQSSPIKNSIGINKILAKDYLSTEPKMKTGFERYAYYTCLSKFTNKNYKPAESEHSIIRHLGTSACLAPRITLAKEACVSQCPELQ